MTHMTNVEYIPSRKKNKKSIYYSLKYFFTKYTTREATPELVLNGLVKIPRHRQLTNRTR